MIFEKYIFVKKELVVISLVVISLVVVGIILSVFVISNLKSETPVINEITNVDNQTSVETKTNLENEYSPKDREWQTSGPFQIDRKQYSIGEKIFLNIGGIGVEEKGQIAFMRPVNDTFYSVYFTVPFDGKIKQEFNYYVEPKILKSKNTCSVDDIIGKWAIVFRGTQYANINFEIIPGPEVPGTDIKSVC